MKYLRQFLIICCFSLAGELLNYALPLPVPASIYGLVLLFAALQAGWLKLSAVQETARFLLEIMPLLFIPAAVGLMESGGALRPLLLPLAVIVLLSTVLVLGVAGRVTQRVIRCGKREASPDE